MGICKDTAGDDGSLGSSYASSHDLDPIWDNFFLALRDPLADEECDDLTLCRSLIEGETLIKVISGMGAARCEPGAGGSWSFCPPEDDEMESWPPLLPPPPPLQLSILAIFLKYPIMTGRRRWNSQATNQGDQFSRFRAKLINYTWTVNNLVSIDIEMDGWIGSDGA